MRSSTALAVERRAVRKPVPALRVRATPVELLRPAMRVATPVMHAECTVDADCDNGNFCDGEETCVSGACVDGTAPCAAGEVCDEGIDTCVTAPACTVDADCTDNLFCTGIETCSSETGACVAGPGDPCGAGETCNEGSDTCDAAPECTGDARLYRYPVLHRRRDVRY